MNYKILLFVMLAVLFYAILMMHSFSKQIAKNLPKYRHIWQNHEVQFENDPWNKVPSLELVIRANAHPYLIRQYSTWFLKSLKLFWPENWLKLTLVLDEERKEDHAEGNRLSKVWPYPKIAFRKPGDPAIYTHSQRRRMYLSYFYPDDYTTAEYVGFVDTDTMFTTVVTPEMLFADGKPTVQARFGRPNFEIRYECWSDVSEYVLGHKEVLQCMTYFPVVMKVAHIVEMREFVAKRHGKPFLEIFKKTFDFKNPSKNGADCLCQYSIMCNYVWYYHRDEYDFHLQMAPDGKWTGDRRRESQQTVEYFKNIDPKYRVPKPRVAIHGKHHMEGSRYSSVSNAFDLTKDPYFTELKVRVREGLCRSLWFDRCPEKCVGLQRDSVQLSIYEFEMFNWLWDKRCLEEQRKHYENVNRLIKYNEKYGRKMFGGYNFTNSCNETYQFNGRMVEWLNG